MLFLAHWPGNIEQAHAVTAQIDGVQVARRLCLALYPFGMGAGLFVVAIGGLYSKPIEFFVLGEGVMGILRGGIKAGAHMRVDLLQQDRTERSDPPVCKMLYVQNKWTRYPDPRRVHSRHSPFSETPNFRTVRLSAAID